MTAPRPLTIRLHNSDNVVVARVDIPAGTKIAEEQITSRDPITCGHKVAAVFIKEGAAVKKYGQIIGFASKDIQPGEHVHTHNIAMKAFDRDYAIGADAELEPEYEAEPAIFQGIVRADGRVATRNYIGIISTVNCSASASRFVADAFKGDALADFPNVDGVVPICHGMGCASSNNQEGFEILLNILAGYIRNPNFGAILVIGLGCEVMQIDTLFQRRELQEHATLVSVDSPDARNRIFPGEIIYLRMHGREDWYSHDYSEEELRETAGCIRDAGPGKVYVFFNNDHAMLGNARRMREILE